MRESFLGGVVGWCEGIKFTQTDEAGWRVRVHFVIKVTLMVSGIFQGSCPMRSCLLLTALMVISTARPVPAQHSASAASRAASTDERALFRLEDAWATALIKRDSAFFRRTLHADYVYSDERGTFTKDQVIAEQVGGTDTVTHAANEGMRAHVHGTAAVVTGILIVRGKGANGPFEHRYRYTDTWIRQGRTWIMIASQDYEMRPS
jgi:hypothetical protein